MYIYSANTLTEASGAGFVLQRFRIAVPVVLLIHICERTVPSSSS
jgi:hypothetical protein